MNHFDIKLISKISHEVMSPVISSKWALEILLSDPNLGLPEDKKIFLRNIYSNLNRISTISNKLINYSRNSVGEFSPVLLEFDVSNLLKKIVKGLCDDFPDSNIKLVISNSDFSMSVDQSMVEFLFHSIIHNAVVYSNPGSEIIIKLDRFVNKDILFEVTDNGIGIPKSDQQKIFSEFFRSSNTDEIYAKGIGLSLFLCKRICDICDYEISFSSKKGLGSVFKVLFPTNHAAN